MALAENVAERLVYKFYASSAISAGSEPTPSSAPAATGGQILRHVDQNLSLAMDSWRSPEKRTDRTAPMGGRGTKRAPGVINANLSPLTYGEPFQAALQGTWAAAITASQSDFTSVSADNATSKFTFAGGNPVSKGFRVGMPLRFTGLADADNNSKNFYILSFGGASNREVTVYPAPDTMSADTSFAVVQVGKTLIRPTSAHVSRKVALEVYNSDVDRARLYTEGRFGGFSLNAPPNNDATVAFNVLMRNRVSYETSQAPFFASPTAQTTTRILGATSGQIYVNGSSIGLITGISLDAAMEARGAGVAFNRLVPDILLGQMTPSGSLTFLMSDSAAIEDLYDDETEFAILFYMVDGTGIAPAAMTFYLPRVKLSSAQESDGGDLGKMVSCNFEASTYEGSAAGVPATVLQICDTEMV
jgi:hypothetical protein